MCNSSTNKFPSNALAAPFEKTTNAVPTTIDTAAIKSLQVNSPVGSRVPQWIIEYIPIPIIVLCITRILYIIIRLQESMQLGVVQTPIHVDETPDFVPTTIFYSYCIYLCLLAIGIGTKSGDFAQQSRFFNNFSFLTKTSESGVYCTSERSG
jgi:hypothetical protein